MSQKTQSKEWNQERLENCLSNLAVSLRLLGDIRIRIRQAVIRVGLQSLLEPTLDYGHRNIEQAIAELSELWRKAEKKGWWE